VSTSKRPAALGKAGIYCIALRGGIEPSASGTVVTPNRATNSDIYGFVHAEYSAQPSFDDCPSGQLGVYMFKVEFNGAGSSVQVLRSDQGFFFSVP
jgi:hypothetical protein